MPHFNYSPTMSALFTFFLCLSYHFNVSVQEKTTATSSLSFPLTLAKKKSSSSSSYVLSDMVAVQTSHVAPSPPFDYNYKSSFRYSMALIVSLPIGTPPQTQQMVLDTGSQLSWIQCHDKLLPKKPTPPTTSFDPSLSSSFSVIPCNHPTCKPRIPDFTLPTTCDQRRLCHYSYFYADGTLSEGNLVREKISFSNTKSTPPLTLGCAVASSSGEAAEGILGMNLGRLSFVSQAKVPKFSYCVPGRRVARGTHSPATGAFYLGTNPNSKSFKYTSLLTVPNGQRMPNFDPLAYTVKMVGIKINGRRLNISESAFLPDAGGSGQTMIDSGTQYTFLVDEAYGKVREEVASLTGARMKKDYAYGGGALDMCFDARDAVEIGRLIGSVAFVFDGNVEISVVGSEGVLDDVGGGVHCVGIGRSDSLGVASNIVGNFHQRDHWVEFDVVGKRIGFAAAADCSAAIN